MPLDRIMLVRHDVTDAANSGIIQGQIDTKLGERFKTRVDALTDLIAEKEGYIMRGSEHIYVISSDLIRTYGTAERIIHRLWDKYGYKAELRSTELLKERAQGILEWMSFEEARPHLSSDPSLPLKPETIYPLLYISNNIPSQERHEAVRERLARFVIEYIQQLEGVGIEVGHLITNNYLRNLLTDGNILGEPPRGLDFFPNLSVVRLQRDTEHFGRYIETGKYGPPNDQTNDGGKIARPLIKTIL